MGTDSKPGFFASLFGGKKSNQENNTTKEITVVDNSEIIETPTVEIIPAKNPKADFSGYVAGGFMYAYSFNGEKNLGEIGPIKNYRIDYNSLRMRSWQSYLESEVTQTIVKRYSTWVIGSGLKLQSEPMKKIFKNKGITIDVQEFTETVEALFHIYRKTDMSDFSNKETLDEIANTALINSLIGGDVLVILRVIEDDLKVQLVDGAHVQSPIYGTEWFPQQLPNGNRIENGIELNTSNEHIAYWVRTGNPVGKVERIPAKGAASGMKMAFLITGLKFRIDNQRTLPLISTVLETLKKMERYKEATLASAEEIAKVAYQIVKKEFSTGESVFTKQVQKAFDVGATSEDLPINDEGKKIANTVAVSTNKQAFDMPIGSEIKALNQSNNQINFKDFYSVNIDIVCAALGIPPNVAMSKYDTNFSASRAAIKDWEHTLNVKRKAFAYQFYQNIYNFWFELQVLLGNISAPQYTKARLTNDRTLLEAYRNARWVGAPVPHIDPVKEVKAERMKLGNLADIVPLTTVEAATENLNGGEAHGNMIQFSEEIKTADGLGIKTPEVPPANSGAGAGAGD